MQGEEAAQKFSQVQMQNYDWGHKPVMSAFCGEKEQEGIYHIFEIKNANGRCASFKEGAPFPRSCYSCGYRMEPYGSSQNIDHRRSIIDFATFDITKTADAASSMLGVFEQTIDNEKATEMHAAAVALGHLPSQPKYLAYCSKYSRYGDYVLCEVQNSHGTCPG
jgi:hypothetical protein